MLSPLRPLVTVALGATLLAAAPLPAQSTGPEEQAALALADSALAAISRGDFVHLTDLMLDSAVTFSGTIRDGNYWTGFRTRAQNRAVDGRGFTERGFHPTVHVSGPLAVVWMPYDFYRDGKWSHCGVDAFTLLRTANGWRIATLSWSVEQPPACQPHPDGPPPVR